MSGIISIQEQLSQAGVGRHETFTPRYGWLKKGYDAARCDGDVFNARDNIERLGVGKNMVRSIRFWCLAFHLLDYQDGEGHKGRKGLLGPTALGNRLHADDGWDPYLEDPASLWLLHWELFVPPLKAASWPLAFNHCFLPTFDLRQLGHSLVEAANQYERLSSLSAGSFDKDASCITRMYTPFSGETSEIECPFSLIGLIHHGEEPNTFRFNVGPKETLPSLIFMAACFIYAYYTQPKQRTLSFHRIVYGFNSPGIAFKVSETEAGRYLDAAAEKMRNVQFIESLGDRQLQFNKSPDDLYWESLEKYYGSKEKGSIWKMKLSDLVFPDINAARSIHIERDLGQTSTLKEYQVTQKSLEVIKRFVSALKGERIYAWSITGPYGMGKSAFSNFLIALVGEGSYPETKLARRKLRQSDNNLHHDLQQSLARISNSRGFFQVPITVAYEPINKSLVSGLLKSIRYRVRTDARNRKIKSLLTSLSRLSKQESPETTEVFNKYKEAHNLFNIPIILVIDEFGKSLEYMAHHPDKGDIYVMQMLAESDYAFIWVCLHQAFEEYASGLTLQQRQEWGKVQGRFEDISFVESTAQMLELTQRVINQKKNKRFSKAVERWATKLAQELTKLRLPITDVMNIENISALYPLHPTAAIALPELCRRFAQNDRTLFSFLCSGDPYALPNFLNRHVIPHNELTIPTLGLDYLYDYFFSAFTTAFIDRAESQRWIEIQDIISQAGSYSDIGQKILKAIGVLNLIAGSSGLRATREILKFALESTLGLEAKEVESEIDDLAERKVLIFREYAHEYRLWEGSDFDIVAAIREKKAILATKPLELVLQEYFPLRPLVASRYSYETGTVRRFECLWMSLSDLELSVPVPNKGFDGLLVYCFGTKKRVSSLPEECSDRRPLLVTYAPNQNQIQELALEVAAARTVLRDAPELVHDGVARKEARFRVRAAEDQLRSYVEQSIQLALRILGGTQQIKSPEIHSYRDLSSLLSDLCKEAFNKCPLVSNEMINYDRLSSAAARARRELAEAMTTRQGEKNLGLEGYGPEVALYRSLFLATNLHKQQNNGRWRFVAPGSDNEDLYPLWELLSERVQEAESEGIRVDSLINELKEPPFGMREGPIPLYICFFLIVNSDEISLFQEGTYKPYFNEADIALLIKRPELFTLKRFTLEGVNRDLFETYLMILNTANIGHDQAVRNPTLLSVVAPLVRFLDNLPPYSRFTRSISKDAQRIRAAVLNSSDPLKLLFEEIPMAIGIEPAKITEGENTDYWKKELQIRLRDGILDITNAYEKLNQRVQELLMEAFKFNGGLSEFYNDLRKKSIRLIPICRDKELRSVLSAIVRENDDLAEWVRGIAGRVMKSPLDSWNDGDIDPFAAAIRDYADRVEHLEELMSAELDNVAIEDKHARVVSIMTNEGRLGRRVLRPKSSDLKKAKDMIDGIKNWTDQEREALYVLLGDEILPQDRNENS